MAEYYKHMNNCDAKGCKYDEPDVCPVVRNIRLATGNIPTLTEEVTPIMQPSLRQVGGDHYKKLAVQPWDVVDTWPIEQQIGYYRGGALKYVMRMGSKDESIQEVNKGLHYLEKLIECLKRQVEETPR
jgi:hypothetical protein